MFGNILNVQHYLFIKTLLPQHYFPKMSRTPAATTSFSYQTTSLKLVENHWQEVRVFKTEFE
jgi:hypothetical protein